MKKLIIWMIFILAFAWSIDYWMHENPVVINTATLPQCVANGNCVNQNTQPTSEMNTTVIIQSIDALKRIPDCGLITKKQIDDHIPCQANFNPDEIDIQLNQ